MQKCVMQHRTVAIGQHKTIAVKPFRVIRIMAIEIIPEHFRDICHAHRHAGMPGFGGFYRINGKESDRIG